MDIVSNVRESLVSEVAEKRRTELENPDFLLERALEILENSEEISQFYEGCVRYKMGHGNPEYCGTEEGARLCVSNHLWHNLRGIGGGSQKRHERYLQVRERWGELIPEYYVSDDHIKELVARATS